MSSKKLYFNFQKSQNLYVSLWEAQSKCLQEQRLTTYWYIDYQNTWVYLEDLLDFVLRLPVAESRPELIEMARDFNNGSST